jgi:hypothetical protein
MANKKFSEFVLKTDTSDVSHIVGYNGAENVQITPANFVTGGGTGVFLPLAGGTMTGNTIHNDNVKSIYGTSSDLEIYHDGSNSRIVDNGTGELRLQGTNLRLWASNGENYLTATEGGSVDLFHSNSKKFETTNTGISVTGDGVFSDNVTIQKASAVNLIVTDGTQNIYVGSSGSARFGLGAGASIIQSTGATFGIGTQDGNALRFGTNNNEVLTLDSSGNSTFDGSVTIKSNKVLTLNNVDNTNGFQLYNSGATGSTNSNLIFLSGAVGERMRLDASGNLGLGTSTPVGDGTALNVYGTTASTLKLQTSSSGTTITDGSEIVMYDNDLIIKNREAGYIQFATSGSEKMRLDASGNLGVGTSSPNDVLEVAGNSATNHRIRINNENASGTETLAFLQGTTFKSWVEYSNSTGYFDIWQHTNNPLRFATNSIERLRVRETGAIEFTGASTTTNAQAYFVNNNTEFQIGSSVSSGVAKPMIFHTTGAETMRLTSVGELLKGTSAAVGQGTLADLNSTEIGNGYINLCRDDTANIKQIRFGKNGAEVGSISTGASATAYNTTSDYRLKEDLQDFKGLDLVSKIPVYDYKWKADDSRSYGVMAHELEEVLPQAVSGEKDAEEMQSVDYSKIVPLLVKSIQELSAKLEALECQCEKK